jgi:hypothetical protein
MQLSVSTRRVYRTIFRAVVANIHRSSWLGCSASRTHKHRSSHFSIGEVGGEKAPLGRDTQAGYHTSARRIERKISEKIPTVNRESLGLSDPGDVPQVPPVFKTGCQATLLLAEIRNASAVNRQRR